MNKWIAFSLLLLTSPVKAALNFPATGYVALDTNTGIIKASTFTFMTWVKLNTTQTVREFITCAGVGTVTGYGMGVDDTTNNKIKFYTANNAGASQNLVSVRTLQSNEWHHVAFTFKSTGSAASANKFLYIDGVLDNSVGTTVVMGYTGATCGLAIYRAAASQYLNGQMDDARFFNRDLTIQEIKKYSNSNVRLPCTIDDGCVAYWKMDEGSFGIQASTVTTLTVRDSSGNGVHGTPRNIAPPSYSKSQLMYQ